MAIWQRPFSSDVPGSNCGTWLAGDGGLTADHFLRMYPGQIVGAELARDGGLAGGGFSAGVHIHFCGHGCHWFRPYGESLGRAERRPAPSNQTLLPLSSGASPRLGIPSLRSCSVGPPPSAIHGRGQLTRHPCRVAHCAEPALGLPMGQEDQNQDQDQQQRGRLRADLTLQACAFPCRSEPARDSGLTFNINVG